MEQKENFKFGGPRLYPSTRALVAWLAIQGRWFLVKIAVVSTQVPLLLSRPVLSQLGMHFKMDENKADFCGLGLKDVKLGYTPSGHPSVEALSFHGQPPVWPDRLDWSVIEVHIPRPAPIAEEAYMASAASLGPVKLFYPKVHGYVEELLTRTVLEHESFLNWWNTENLARDFWVESEHFLDRIHVTPRRTFFDPTKWNTSHSPLRETLLESLGDLRESTCIPCYAKCPTLKLEHHWHEDGGPRAEFLWIGRSRFPRKPREPEVASPGPLDVIRSNFAMEDEQGRTGGEVGVHGCALASRLDCARVAHHVDGGVGDPRAEQEQASGADSPLSGRLEEEVLGRGDPTAGEGHAWCDDQAPPRECATVSGGGGLLRELQGLYVQGSQRVLSAMGYGRGEQQSATQCRPGPTGQVGSSSVVNEHYQPPSEPRGSPSGADAVWGSAEGQAEDQSIEQGVTSKDSTDIENPTLGDKGGQHRLLRGGLAGGRSDQGYGGSSGGTSDDQGSGGEGEGESQGGSRTRLKKKAYWKKVEELVRLRRSIREAALPYIPDDEHTVDEIYDQDNLDVDEYDMDQEEGAPKVNLKYPLDYETVRNLPSKRMKRASRKRVTGWARRALLCLTTTLVALAAPVAAEVNEAVVEPLRDMASIFVKPREDEPVALLELFAGSAKLTTEFAAQGYNVLEP